MSARSTNEWKVGAFVVGAFALLLATLFWLGANRFDAETVERVTYFDESVQGLEVGAPVKIRGVTIGKVTAILLAPDRRLVEVRSDIRVDAMRRLKLLGDYEPADPTAASTPSEMRMIVAAQGITGVKFLEADFFPPETPKLELSFNAPPTYVPSAPSTLKSIEDAVRTLGEELPEALTEFRQLARTFEDRIAGVDLARVTESVAGLAEDIRTSLDPANEEGVGVQVDGLLRDLRRATASVDALANELRGDEGAVRALAEELTAAVSSMRATFGLIDAAFEGVDLRATVGAVTSAATAAEQLAQSGNGSVRDLPGLLTELRGAVRSFDRLVTRIERDPGMFLRGGPANPDR